MREAKCGAPHPDYLGERCYLAEGHGGIHKANEGCWGTPTPATEAENSHAHDNSKETECIEDDRKAVKHVEAFARLKAEVPEAFIRIAAYCTHGCVEHPNHNLWLWEGDLGDVYRAAYAAAEARVVELEKLMQEQLDDTTATDYMTTSLLGKFRAALQRSRG